MLGGLNTRENYWVVKLIDVYPDEYAGETELGGYQLPVAMDILRGRYREGFAAAKPVKAKVPLTYRFALPKESPVLGVNERRQSVTLLTLSIDGKGDIHAS